MKVALISVFTKIEVGESEKLFGKRMGNIIK
jgi:hypothetical protein